jgi:hypothetical protein
MWEQQERGRLVCDLRPQGPGDLPPAPASPGDWETGCWGWWVPKSHHHRGPQTPGEGLAAGPDFEAQLVGKPRGQAAPKVLPHCCPGCRHHCPYWGPPGAAGDPGARGCGWHHGIHGMRAGGPAQGNGPGLGCDYGVAWTSQDWDCGTWVPEAQGCCHPPRPSWSPSCRRCCWPTPR